LITAHTSVLIWNKKFFLDHSYKDSCNLPVNVPTNKNLLRSIT